MATQNWFSRIREGAAASVNGAGSVLAWIGRAVARLVRRVIDFLWGIPQWTVGHAFKVLLLLVLAAAVLVAGALYFVTYYPSTQVADNAPATNIVYLDQGWGPTASSKYRQQYYYTPQGTSVASLRYSWFIHLQQVRTSDLFVDPGHMRAFGFLVDNTKTEMNPDQLPVGFTKHYDPVKREDLLDITCAACHTGELHYTGKDGQRVAIRIDGGAAMHAFTAMKLGHFGPTLLAAMARTYLNPWRWHKFARAVLGDEHYESGNGTLRLEFGKVLWALLRQGYFDRAHKLYPVEEGFGRTDAVGRISNTVFGGEVDEANYRVANAPVSFPAVWDIWKFDWVQYTASVAQPLARNLGESLGVGAAVPLHDLYGRPLPPKEWFQGATLIENLAWIEENLQRLQPPKWPEEILGKIDQQKATAGKELYAKHCKGCHEPCEATAEERAVQMPLKKPDEPLWHIKMLPVDDIGTDPQAALNFVNTRISLAKTGITDEDAREWLREIYTERLNRQIAYRKAHPSNTPPRYTESEMLKALDGIDVNSLSIGAGLNIIGIPLRRQFYKQFEYIKDVEQRRRLLMEYDGFGALDTPQVLLVYKARPLAGVWATAPYLHNGSVPTLYDMLSPADERPKKFFISRMEFDPEKVGLVGQPPASKGFWFDTSIAGNRNIGHEFRAGYGGWTPGAPPSHGLIGPELTKDQRWALIEYLKVHVDEKVAACTAYGSPEY
jgi:mono/diheme cytochrome c family protein